MILRKEDHVNSSRRLAEAAQAARTQMTTKRLRQMPAAQLLSSSW